MKYLDHGKEYFTAYIQEEHAFLFGVACFEGAKIQKLFKNHSIELNVESFSITLEDETIVNKYLTIQIDYSSENQNNIDFFLRQYVTGRNAFISNQNKLDFTVDLMKKVFSSKYIDKIGLCGELLYILKNGVKSIKYWHSNSNDLFDFIQPNKVFEIKTTASSIRSHAMKFIQLEKALQDDREVFITSVMIKSNNDDISLTGLVDLIRSKCSQELLKIFNDKIEPYNGIIDNIPICNFYESLETIKFFEIELFKNIIECSECIEKNSISFKVDFNKLKSPTGVNNIAEYLDDKKQADKKKLSTTDHVINDLLKNHHGFTKKNRFYFDSNNLKYKVKVSKYYPKNNYFWYSIVESDYIELDQENKLGFVFVLENVGYCIPKLDELKNYLRSAKYSPNQNGSVKHRHLYLKILDGSVLFVSDLSEFKCNLYEF